MQAVYRRSAFLGVEEMKGGPNLKREMPEMGDLES